MMPVSVIIESFLDAIQEVKQENDMASDAENRANEETQDILHDLEINPHSFNEKGHLASDLARVRAERRRAKDFQNDAYPLLKWVADNASAMRKLQEVLGETRKIEKKMETRVYMPRVRK